MEKKSLDSLSSFCTQTFGGAARVPGDKSISHRALMIGSQLLGTLEISGLLEGEDVLCTAQALREMGINIEQNNDQWTVHGNGIGGLHEPKTVLKMGNSGTSTRLLMGLLAPYPFSSFFEGDASLSQRPMQRVITPLSRVGAHFTARDGDKLPLAMTGASTAMPITYELPVASAQVKSALLLSGINTAGTTTVIEPVPTRDHTERMFSAFGIPIQSAMKDGGNHISVTGHPEQRSETRSLSVPGDPSSAAFLIAAALLVPGSSLTIENVLMNEHRTGLFTTLIEMGASIKYTNEREHHGEPVADILVSHAPLKGIHVPADRAPSMIDEYPILSVIAAFAEGTTRMDGVAELRVKESNRLQAMIDGLTTCGIKAKEEGDSLIVTGVGDAQAKGDAVIETHHDHRIAMSFLVMGMRCEQRVTVDDASPIQTSFPNFVSLMNQLGGKIRSEESGLIEPQTLPPMVIAIDGPAASGKGTLGRRLSDALGFSYLDTGSLYRAVGLRTIINNVNPRDEEEAVRAAYDLKPSDLTDFRLRSEEVGNAASIVSAVPKVREILLDYQRNYAANHGGAVLDGRDIGTVVCPDADVKFFISAGIETRARRRYNQLVSQGISAEFNAVKQDLVERDERDSKRKTAPLTAAKDAISIDTSDMTADEVYDTVLSTIQQRFHSI